MKKNLLLLLASCFLLLGSVSATNVSGFISANTTWNLAGSPYIVVGNTLLSHGYTLTIDPGVVVKFNNVTTLQIDGEIHAIGTAANRITFTSNQAVPAPGDWGNLHFDDTCANAVFDTSGNYLSGCIMKYCDVLYASGLGAGAIHIESSSPYFSLCRIDSCTADGIHCVGSSFLIDSSAIKHCTGYGLSFTLSHLNSCGITVIGDTLYENGGGISFGATFGNCLGHAVRIHNNLFQSNNSLGAINNSSSSDSIIITENYFMNNTVGVSANALITLMGANTNTIIECNNVIGNQMISGCVLYMPGCRGGRIRNNIFDSNITSGNVSVASIASNQSTAHLYFDNNYITNNTAVNGTCIIFIPIYNNNHLLHIDHNEFSGNTATRIIKIQNGIIGSGDLDFIYFKHNNFLDQSPQIELYNDVAYGSPNLYIDSNYWGGTSTQHIDSLVYDFFDDASKSVVYYSPILTSPASIDTTCLPPIIAAINTIERKNSGASIFPNPFTTTATISINKEIHGGSLRLINLFGQTVMEKNNINGNSYTINRENLSSGIYLFEVSEKGNTIYSGKAVVY